MKILIFGLVGTVLGYYAGAYVSCIWLWPEMNLCGLAGVFITGPLGLVVGSVAGWRQSRRKGAQKQTDGV